MYGIAQISPSDKRRIIDTRPSSTSVGASNERTKYFRYTSVSFNRLLCESDMGCASRGLAVSRRRRLFDFLDASPFRCRSWTLPCRDSVFRNALDSADRSRDPRTVVIPICFSPAASLRFEAMIRAPRPLARASYRNPEASGADIKICPNIAS